MYTNPCDTHALGMWDPYVGLGQMPVRGVIVGGSWGRPSTTNPCTDTLFRIRNAAACARMGYGSGLTPRQEKEAPPPPPPPPPPRRTEPTIAMPPPVEYTPPPTIDPPKETWTPGPDPIVETLQEITNGAPAPEPTVVSVGGGGWGGGGQQLAPDVSVQAGDVIVEGADEPERGFGLLEFAIGSAIAWVLASSYRTRKGRR